MLGMKKGDRVYGARSEYRGKIEVDSSVVVSDTRSRIVVESPAYVFDYKTHIDAATVEARVGRTVAEALEKYIAWKRTEHDRLIAEAEEVDALIDAARALLANPEEVKVVES